VIYFIQAEDKAIKIGYTKHREIAQRLSTIQTSCPLKIEVLGVIEGEYPEEKELHFLFTQSRIRGEWFDLSILREVVKIINEKGIIKDNMPPEVQRLWTLNKEIRTSKNEDTINHLVYEKEMFLKGQWLMDSKIVT